jgi:hypothetical protein
MQPPICHLLRIPQELRDEIYVYYLGDEGYHHPPETNTLRHKDGKAIDIALVFTCKQVAAEMAGLPLKLNFTIFKTHLACDSEMEDDDGWIPPSWAGCFNFLSDCLQYMEAEASSVAFNACGKINIIPTRSIAVIKQALANHLL